MLGRAKTIRTCNMYFSKSAGDIAICFSNSFIKDQNRHVMWHSLGENHLCAVPYTEPIRQQKFYTEQPAMRLLPLYNSKNF